MMYYKTIIDTAWQKDLVIIVQPLGDGGVRTFPEDESNPDYQQYLAWLAEGNTPEEWNPDAN